MQFVLVLLLQAAPVSPDLLDARQRTERLANRTDKAWAEIEISLTNRFAEVTDNPRTGLIVASDEAVGADGLHATRVLVVMRDSPALRAGIKPGDRILHIGQRRIEHESTEVVRLLLEDRPGTVEVTIERDGRAIVIPVHRAPLTCLRAAAQTVDVDRWLTHTRNMRAGLVKLRALMQSHPDNPFIILDAGSQVVNIAQALPEVTVAIRSALDLSTMKHCGVDAD
jgi:C-terminal processing protease CtpA/Prc